MMRILLTALLAMSACSAACSAAPRPPQAVKIALVAPFEGRDRTAGYGVFPAFRTALREHMSATPGGANVAFVAFDDGGDPAKAEAIARSVALDPEVVAVIGHFKADTTLAALGVYTAAGLPIVAIGPQPDQLPGDALVFAPPAAAREPTMRQVKAFAAAADLFDGASTASAAAEAYNVTRWLLSAIDAAARERGLPSRDTAAAALRQLHYEP